jgi:hypothetical protein
MFIRKKPNKSGTISVQVIKKVGRSNRIVKTIGFGTTAEELEALERRARTELEMLRPQLSFSFDQYCGQFYRELKRCRRIKNM